MKIVNDGSIYTVEKLIFYLTEFFGFDEAGSPNSLESQISYIENHEGGWTIGFTTVPDRALLLAIITMFETRMGMDGIIKMIYNYGTPGAIEIDDVAGCYWTSPEAMVEALETQAIHYTRKDFQAA